jgi:predicted ATPase/DNA-binding XRE family transcriptional regulator
LTELSFGEWLKRQRKAAGLTQEQLAAQVNCSTITLRKIEAEERRPSEQIAARLAEIFNIPPQERPAFVHFARVGWGVVPASSRESAPWQIPPAPPSNLPFALTSLVGREQEIAELSGYLQQAEIRLVTLTGSPGIGKTRLAIGTARRVLPHFPHGVFFFSLAPLTDPSLIVPAALQILGYVEDRHRPAAQHLKESIAEKQILLVLDNCEHLIEHVAPFAFDLLSACPRLKILTTSREALRIPGEWLYPVPPLALPPERSFAGLEAAAASPALTLFLERARAARPDFRLTAENIRAVAAICEQLDGLPLAIELLAARIRWMSPQALLERMSADFVLSADGMRAVPARQKTLHNAIASSYHLLSPEEQTLLTALSVFLGGFTAPMAEAVFFELFPQNSIPALIDSLADKSLLQRSFNARGETRFHMLVTIRQFAQEILRHSGKETHLRDLHLAYFVEFAERGEREIRGPNQAEWAERIQSEQNNLRAALAWAVSSHKTEQALRLLAALGWPWEIRAHYSEAMLWLERIRALPDVMDYPLPFARLLNHIGRYCWTQDNFQKARALLEESRDICLRLGEAGKPVLAETLNWLGLLEIGQNKEAARPLLEQSLELNRECQNEWGIALSTFHLGILESNSDRIELARTLLENSLSTFRSFGDLFFISRVSIFLGYLFLDQEDFETARQYFEQHRLLDAQLQFWDGIAEAWRDLGNLSRALGDLEQAEQYYQQGRAVCREHGLTKTIP